MDNLLNSGREDDTESTLLGDQQERVEERQGEEVSEWGKRVYECHQGGEYVGRHLGGLGRLCCQGQLNHHLNLWSLLWWGMKVLLKVEGRTV